MTELKALFLQHIYILGKYSDYANKKEPKRLL